MNDVSETIGWAHKSINVVSGCTRGCSYCYARRMSHRLRGRYGYPQDDPFKPTFHEDKLGELLLYGGRNKRIFICSMGELFSPDVPDEWVRMILRAVRINGEEGNGNRYIFLTKNPHLLAKWNPWPENAWVGATATDFGSFVQANTELEYVQAPVRFLSVEPLLGRINCEDFKHWSKDFPDWLIIGGLSGPKRFFPPEGWIRELEGAADKAGVPIFEKANLRQTWPTPPRREFPCV